MCIRDRVKKLMPGLNACFVDVGFEKLASDTSDKNEIEDLGLDNEEKPVSYTHL